MANFFSALEAEFDEAVRGLAADDEGLVKADAYLSSAHAAHRRGS